MYTTTAAPVYATTAAPVYTTTAAPPVYTTSAPVYAPSVPAGTAYAGTQSPYSSTSSPFGGFLGGGIAPDYTSMGEVDDDEGYHGYQFSQFPAGPIATATDNTGWTLSDSNAFNGMSGIPKTSMSYDPYADSKNNTALADYFQAGSEVAAMSSALPGSKPGGLSQNILDQFDAGRSTLNSLPDALDGFSTDKYGREVEDGSRMNTNTLEDQHKTAYSVQMGNDANFPLMPFNYVYPNFGNSGTMDYGFADGDSNVMNEAITKAFQTTIPEGRLSGVKTDFLPVFNNVNQEALEERPLLQSLGKLKNTRWIGGATTLPDDLRIDPRGALLSGENAPADLVETSGELEIALQALGYHGAAGGTSAYGARMPRNQMIAQTNDEIPAFYNAQDEMWQM